METDKTKENERRLLIALGILVGALVILAILGAWFIKPAEPLIQGQADATSVRVSGKLPGRVTEFFVKEGDRVKRGDTLVHIHSSTADALLYQAQSMEDAASAQNRKIDAGTRTQIINAARNLWIEAKAALTISEKTYKRMENLYRQGVISEQKRDEALAAYNAGIGNVFGYTDPDTGKHVDGWLDDPEYSDDGITLKEIPFKETLLNDDFKRIAFLHIVHEVDLMAEHVGKLEG